MNHLQQACFMTGKDSRVGELLIRYNSYSVDCYNGPAQGLVKVNAPEMFVRLTLAKLGMLGASMPQASFWRPWCFHSSPELGRNHWSGSLVFFFSLLFLFSLCSSFSSFSGLLILYPPPTSTYLIKNRRRGRSGERETVTVVFLGRKPFQFFLLF